jgi:hypothetical protein
VRLVDSWSGSRAFIIAGGRRLVPHTCLLFLKRVGGRGDREVLLCRQVLTVKRHCRIRRELGLVEGWDAMLLCSYARPTSPRGIPALYKAKFSL